MTDFSLDLALSIVSDDQEQDFKVDFDPLWQWSGYSRKDHAKRMLGENFEKDFDYIRFSPSKGETPLGGRPRGIIKLTLDAAKNFAMMAQTDQGREVRRYFIEAEKQLRLIQRPKSRLELAKEQVRMIEALETQEKRLRH